MAGCKVLSFVVTGGEKDAAFEDLGEALKWRRAHGGVRAAAVDGPLGRRGLAMIRRPPKPIIILDGTVPPADVRVLGPGRPV